MTSAFTGFVTLLVPAIAYFTGYAYLDGYFEVFDISIQEVSPGLQQVLAHGGNFYVSLLAGIWQSYWAVPVLLGLLLSAAALFQAVGSGRQPDWLGPWRWLVAHRAEALVVLEVVIVVLSLYAAITRAHDMGAARAEFDRLSTAAANPATGRSKTRPVAERPGALACRIASGRDGAMAGRATLHG